MRISKCDIIALGISLAVCLVAGFIGSIAVNDVTLAWYATLNKSSLNPPAWVFAPVWTMLYLSMGVALFIIIKERKHSLYKLAMVLFAVQLVLNILWSHIFFATYSPAYGLLVIVMLDLAVIFLFAVLSIISIKAQLFILPYLVWILFATYLNWYVANNNFITTAM